MQNKDYFEKVFVNYKNIFIIRNQVFRNTTFEGLLFEVYNFKNSMTSEVRDPPTFSGKKNMNLRFDFDGISCAYLHL